ncbi:MAG: RIP metalloprotease RseP [Acetatifactor sp.]|nr:RIP metalloprotease RseP [Acetatifactor sp.]
MTLILFVLIFGVVVIAHEFGHFIIAKANGIKVLEFFVGMGPTLFSFTKGGTKYSLKLFPIGGACMFEGEDGVQEKDEATGEYKELSSGAFNKAGVWSRIATVFAGPFFNFILAFLVSLIMVNMTDVIAIRDPVLSEVVEDGAAAEAGLMPGDMILSLNGRKLKLYQEITLFMQVTYQGGDVEVVYRRDGEVHQTTLTPQYDEEYGRYMLGVVNSEFVTPTRLQSFKYAWYEMRFSVKATFESLGMLVRGKVTRNDVAGPVGIAVNVVGKTYEETKDYGWRSVLVSMLNIVLMLSVNLGILNLLPLPALDGGRLVFLLIEVIRGKPIPPEKEGLVHFVGLMFFMALMVFVFFNDLRNIFL